MASTNKRIGFGQFIFSEAPSLINEKSGALGWLPDGSAEAGLAGLSLFLKGAVLNSRGAVGCLQA
jgi:hypothetical protein